MRGPSTWPTAQPPRFAVRDRSGFTLLELLLAMTVTALVVTVVYSAWHGALVAWREGSLLTDTLQRQRVVMETLADLTESAVYFGTDAEMYAVKGEDTGTDASSVSFVTASNAALPPREALLTGLRRVTIALETGPRGEKYLAISNDPAMGLPLGESERVWHVLSHDVIGFSVRFQNPRDNEWHDKWSEELTLPSAMEFAVTFAPRDDRSQPVIIERAIQLPSALYAMENKGRRPEKLSGASTNQTDEAAGPGGTK